MSRLAIDLSVPERSVQLRAQLATGSVTAVLGPNGAGKSTLLEAVAGDVPAWGSVRRDGTELLTLARGRRGVVHLGQDPVLFSALSTLGNVTFALEAHGTTRRAARARARELLAEVEMQELADRRPGELSGGQQQRVALARALALDPQLVLLDEPFAALDVDGAARLRTLVARMLEGRTVLLVTHDLLDVLSLAHDVLVLEDGRVIQHGDRREVLAHPYSALPARLAGRVLLRGHRQGPDHIRVGAHLLEGIAEDAEGPDAASDREALGLLDPASVQLLRVGTGPSAGEQVVQGVVTGLDLHGHHVLIHMGALAVAVDAEAASADPVRIGERIRMLIPRAALRLYAGTHDDPHA